MGFREYRLTRNRLYETMTCLGHTNLALRDGHYIQAESAHKARVRMCELYPEDAGDFTCDLWKDYTND